MAGNGRVPSRSEPSPRAFFAQGSAAQAMVGQPSSTLVYQPSGWLPGTRTEPIRSSTIAFTAAICGPACVA